MGRLVLLDGEPLGLACHRPGHSHGDHCRLWIDSLTAAGVRVIVPEIIDYELRRELIRVGAAGGWPGSSPKGEAPG